MKVNGAIHFESTKKFLRDIINSLQNAKVFSLKKSSTDLSFVFYTCVEYFKGRNFRGFHVISLFWRNFMNLKILKQPNVKVFSRKIIDIFKIAKVFFERCKTYFSANLKALHEIYCF